MQHKAFSLMGEHQQTGSQSEDQLQFPLASPPVPPENESQFLKLCLTVLCGVRFFFLFSFFLFVWPPPAKWVTALLL